MKQFLVLCAAATATYVSAAEVFSEIPAPELQWFGRVRIDLGSDLSTSHENLFDLNGAEGILLKETAGSVDIKFVVQLDDLTVGDNNDGRVSIAPKFLIGVRPQIDENGWTALHHAVNVPARLKDGRVLEDFDEQSHAIASMVEKLLGYGINAFAKTHNGETALMIAARNFQVPAIGILKSEAPALARYSDGHGRNAMHSCLLEFGPVERRVGIGEITEAQREALQAVMISRTMEVLADMGVDHKEIDSTPGSAMLNMDMKTYVNGINDNEDYGANLFMVKDLFADLDYDTSN